MLRDLLFDIDCCKLSLPFLFNDGFFFNAVMNIRALEGIREKEIHEVY
jgi:hypothetical protein